MADKPINNAPEQSDAMHSVYVRKNNSTNDLTQVPANQFAHAVGLTAANRGRFFRVNSSGDVESVAAGTSSQFLGWDSSGDLVAKTATTPAMVQIGSKQTISSPVSAVTFTNIPSSGYSRFILVGINPLSSVAAASDNMQIQVSTDNGSTFKTTSGDYYDGTTARVYLTRFSTPAASATFPYSSFVVEMTGLGNSSRPTFGITTTSFVGNTTTNISTQASSLLNGVRQAAEADNALRIVTDGGENITSGIFVLYGVVES